jgi:hypothetical protein
MIETTRGTHTTRAQAPSIGGVPADARPAPTEVTAAVRQAVRAYGGAPDVPVPRAVAADRRAGEPA